VDVRSQVTDVQVYRRGARVTRTVTLSSPASGPLTVPGLPLSLDDGTASVQVTQGDAEVRALQVRLHLRPRDEAPLAPDEQALRDVLRRIHHQQAALDQLHTELALLEGIDMPSRPTPVQGQAPPPAPLAARVALDAFVHDECEARHQAIIEADNTLEELQEQADDLRRRLAEADAGRQARPDELSKAATATLVVRGEPDQVVLKLHYLVPGAHWVPQYQLDVAADGSRAELTVQAAVVQASGEDWRGVRLTLSTATPQEACDLPELHSLRIGRAQAPPPGRAPRPAPLGAERLYADHDQARSALKGSRPAAPSLPSVPARPELPDVTEPAAAATSFVMSSLAVGDAAFGRAAGGSAALEEEEAEGFAVDSLSAADEPMAAPAAQPAPAPKAAPRRRQARARKKKGARAPMPPQEEPAEAAASATPHYPGLVLPAFTSSDRGHLRVADPADRARRDLAGGDQPPLGFDPAQRLRKAQRQAVAAARLPPPDGTRAVRPDRFDHAYRAEAPVDVPSRRRWQVVPVVHAAAEAALRYVAVPREEPAAYRIASVANPLGQPLLPGPVEVSVDGSYVLTSSLPATGTGEPLELGLGVEPGLRVARNTRFAEERPDQRAVSMTELHHTIEITLHNTLSRSVPVEVRERIPQPATDAEVDVTEREVSPAWEPYDQKERGQELRGGRRWQVTLGAGERTDLVATYVVSLYAKLEVAGGNRREA